MNVQEYEAWIESRRQDTTKIGDLNYDLVALSGEVGELLGEYKKALRGSLTGKALRESILLEAGDTLHYLVRTLHDIDSNLIEAAEANIEKLTNREKYGKGKHGKRS